MWYLLIFHQIHGVDVGGNQGRDGHNNIVEHGEIRFFRLLKSGLNHLSLPFRSGKVRIHKAETAVGHRLDAVQMVHSCAL